MEKDILILQNQLLIMKVLILTVKDKEQYAEMKLQISKIESYIKHENGTKKNT